MKQHTWARFGRALSHSINDYELVEAIRKDSIPERTDLSLIPVMYSYYNEHYPSREDREYQKELFIASVLNLFDKMCLKYGCIASHGISTTLATVFGHNNRQSLTDILARVKVKFNKNPRFREVVISICSELKSRFEDRPVSNGQVSLFDVGGGE